MNQKRVSAAIIGLGFGAEFIPIYQKHPGAELHAICQRDAERLQKIGDTFGVPKRYTRYEDVLADPHVDFVHINSPIPDHAWMSIAALKAGKHVLCTVPMATTVEECHAIVDLVQQTGLQYMMAETVVYSREFLFLRELYQKGELGKIQYLQASHPQDMDGWPEYWQRMIPMHYATHVVSPCLGLMNSRAEYVSCCGSGTVREDIRKKSGNRFASSPAISRLRTRTLWPISGGSCTTLPGSTARASTCTAQSGALNGRWWRASRTSCTRPRNRSRRSRRRYPCRTSPTCCRNRFVRSRVPFRTPNIFRSFREPGMAARTRTWSTSS